MAYPGMPYGGGYQQPAAAQGYPYAQQGLQLFQQAMAPYPVATATAYGAAAPPPTAPGYAQPQQAYAQPQPANARNVPAGYNAPPGSHAYNVAHGIAQMEVIRKPGAVTALPGPLPTSCEAFVAMRDQVARTPYGGALCFCVAMYVYSNVDKNLGSQFLAVALDAKHVAKAEGVSKCFRVPAAAQYKGFQPAVNVLRDMDSRVGPHKNPKHDKSHLPRSFFEGTSPDNGYAVNHQRLAIRVKRQSRDANNPGRIFVHSTGSDLPKPIKLQQNQRGIWKAVEWSSLQCSVRPPKRLQPHEADCL